MAKKKIDLTQMKEALRLVEEELEDLEEQSEKFIENVLKENKQNHSKFTDELDDVFRTFKRNQKKYILEAIKKYTEDIRAVCSGWTKVDDELSKQINGGE